VITGLAGRPSRDAAATPYSEEGAVGYPMAYRTLTLMQNPVGLVGSITSLSKKASSPSQRRRLKSYPSRDNCRLSPGQKDFAASGPTIGVISPNLNGRP
jgi:hypothetical protein